MTTNSRSLRKIKVCILCGHSFIQTSQSKDEITKFCLKSGDFNNFKNCKITTIKIPKKDQKHILRD